MEPKSASGLRYHVKDLERLADVFGEHNMFRSAHECRKAAMECLAYADEADALRKENEELRSIVDYVASFMQVEDVGDDVACPGVVVSSERLEEDSTTNGILGFDECEHPFHQPIIDVLRRSAKARSDRLSEAPKSTAKCASLSEEIDRIKAEDGRAK